MEISDMSGVIQLTPLISLIFIALRVEYQRASVEYEPYSTLTRWYSTLNAMEISDMSGVIQLTPLISLIFIALRVEYQRASVEYGSYSTLAHIPRSLIFSGIQSFLNKTSLIDNSWC